ncbi:hypothetical protein LCGC14_2926180, partial [marine sediment metagenome]
MSEWDDEAAAAQDKYLTELRQSRVRGHLVIYAYVDGARDGWD